MKVKESERLVNENAAANMLDWAVQTMRNNRYLRRGPAYIKLGRSVRYRVVDLLDYISKHRIDPEKME